MNVSDHPAEIASEYTTKVTGAALKRMKRAHDRGTGCHLTAEMIQELSVTLMAEWWENLDDDGSSLL